MFYWLYTVFGDEISGMGVFRYISFRTAWGLITALTVSWVLLPMRSPHVALPWAGCWRCEC